MLRPVKCGGKRCFSYRSQCPGNLLQGPVPERGVRLTRVSLGWTGWSFTRTRYNTKEIVIKPRLVRIGMHCVSTILLDATNARGYSSRRNLRGLVEFATFLGQLIQIIAKRIRRSGYQSGYVAL